MAVAYNAISSIRLDTDICSKSWSRLIGAAVPGELPGERCDIWIIPKLCPPSPFASKSGGSWPPSSYGSAAPGNGGVKCKVVWKKNDFQLVSRFISKMMQDRAIITMEGE